MQATASSQKVSSPPGEFSRGKTIFVLAVVIGCFTILWPKIFYPMLTASLSGDDTECCDMISEQDANAYNLMNQICARIVEREKRVATETLQQQQQNQSGQGQAPPATKGSPAGRKMYTPPPARLPSHIVCRNEILKTCGLDVLVLVDESPKMSRQYKVSLAKLRSYNTSQCLKENYGVDFHTVGLPRRFRNPEAHLSPSHMRPERPIHFHRPEPVHPAMKERGAAIPHTIPQRTLEKEARPGPFPGVRPPVGGAGFQAPAPKGGGTMGIIMPLYTIAIVVFFVYTIMKILFRKPEEKPQPILKDFHMDPEHRKFVFAEEYQAGSERSMKDQMKKDEQQENQGLRKRSLSSTKSGSVDRSRLGMRDRDARDIEIDLLRKRLEETEAAMERIVQQMGTVSDRLSPSNLAPVLNETQVNHKSSSKLANSTAQQEVTPEKSALTPTEATAPSKVQEEVELIAKPKKVKILEVPQTLEGRSAEVTEDEEDEEQEPEDRPAPLIPEPQPRPDDEEDEEEEEELEEEIPVRPPTPPKSKRQASTDSTAAITKYAETLANRVVKLGEQEAAKVLQLESQSPPRTSSPSVGVVNLEGTLEMANGHKLRSPTPPNVRTLSMSPLPPHESAPEVSKEKEQVPSIVLEGHIPSAASSVLISALSDSQDELRHLGDDDDEEAEELEQDSVSSPVVLSGKVTLSVIAGGPADDQPTEATSLSVDDYAKAISAADSTQPATADAEEDEEEEEEEEDEEEDEEEEEELPVRQAPTAAKTNQANGGIAQQNGTKGESKEDGEGTHYTTADKGETADNQAEETAEDISALEGLDDGRQDDILPSDTEDEAEEEEDVEDEEEDEEEEEEEEDEDENLPNNVPNKGPPV